MGDLTVNRSGVVVEKELANNANVFLGVQFLRFVAAFLVLIAHATLAIYERIQNTGFLVWENGAVGVKIFFVISGFVMVFTSESLRSGVGAARLFFKRRAVRIVPMYWLTTTAKLFLLLAAPSFALHSSLDWAHVFTSYFLVPHLNIENEFRPIHAVGWTLLYEAYFYATFAISLMFGFRPIVFVAIVFSLLSICGFLFPPETNSLYVFYSNPVVMLFVAGMCIAELVRRNAKVPIYCAFGLVMVFVMNFLMIEYFGGPINHWLFYSGASSVFLVGGVVFLEPVIRSFVPGIIIKLGGSSYSLYLIHPFILGLLAVIIHRMGHLNLTVILCLMCGAGVLAGVLTERLIELPMMQFLRRRM